MQLASPTAPYRASDITFPFADDYSKIAGELQYNRFGGGLEMRVDGEKFVFGNPAVLNGFAPGDIVQITGEIAARQDSVHQSGTDYSVATAQAFSGMAHLTKGGKAVIFSDGYISGMQG